MTLEAEMFGMKHVALTWDARCLVRYQGIVMEVREAVRRFCTENHDSGDEHRGREKLLMAKPWERCSCGCRWISCDYCREECIPQGSTILRSGE